MVEVVTAVAASVGPWCSRGTHGVMLDLNVFASYDVDGVSVLTSLSVPDSSGSLRQLYPLSPLSVEVQFASLYRMGSLGAVRLTLCEGAPELHRILSGCILRLAPSVPLIVSPWLCGAGSFSVSDAAQCSALLRRADALVVDHRQAEALLSGSLGDCAQDWRDACLALHGLAPSGVVVLLARQSGGRDYVFDGKALIEFPVAIQSVEEFRLRGEMTPGTLTALCARGDSVQEALDCLVLTGAN